MALYKFDFMFMLCYVMFCIVAVIFSGSQVINMCRLEIGKHLISDAF